jgi:UDP-N-acetylglucosamine 2-epimerase (non-hydrolysing)
LITCFIGTRAQLIKMAPVILEMERRSMPMHLVLTGQHKETMEQLLGDFGIRTAPIHLYQGKEITGVVQMATWFLKCLWECVQAGDRFLPRSNAGNDVVLVHGDTVSTLLGAIAGRVRGLKVAHIEAGLRSRNLLHPFPEELTRLAVSRLSHLAFCPGEWAYENAARYQAVRVDTQHNTLIEALSIALASPHAPSAPFGGEDFGIASIHRFENIFSKTRLTSIVGMIEQAAERYPLAFVLHPSTRKKLAQAALLPRLEGNPRVTLLPRMGYVEFVRLMQQSRFVITDGGGNQEELSYLGIPTLLMRKATERKEGMDTTAILCGYDRAVLADFLAELPDRPTRPQAPAVSPTQIIVDELAPYAG